MNNRYARVATAAAAVPLAVVLAAWFYGGSRRDVATEEGTPKKVASGDQAVSARSTHVSPSLGGVEIDRLADKAVRFPVVVRVRMMAVDEQMDLVCNVTSVIYGRVSCGELRVETGMVDMARRHAREKLGREPTEAELRAHVGRQVGLRPGREAILVLEETETEAGTAYSYRHKVFGNPRRSLENAERVIVQQYWTGANLSPDPGEEGDLKDCIRGSERVVVAKVATVGDTLVQWKVTEVLGVMPPEGRQFDATPTTISISLQPWRLRAAAIARYHTPSGPEPRAMEEQIQAELQRILKAELWVGREAILFLRPAENANAKASYGFVGILHDDPDDFDPSNQYGPGFEKHKRTIRELIKTREKWEREERERVPRA